MPPPVNSTRRVWSGDQAATAMPASMTPSSSPVAVRLPSAPAAPLPRHIERVTAAILPERETQAMAPVSARTVSRNHDLSAAGAGIRAGGGTFPTSSSSSSSSSNRDKSHSYSSWNVSASYPRNMPAVVSTSSSAPPLSQHAAATEVSSGRPCRGCRESRRRRMFLMLSTGACGCVAVWLCVCL